jgi:hypothetical protein
VIWVDALVLARYLSDQRKPVAGMPSLRGTPQEAERRRHPAVRPGRQGWATGAAPALLLTRWAHLARLRGGASSTVCRTPE